MNKRSNRRGGSPRTLSDQAARRVINSPGEPGDMRFDPFLNKWMKPTVHVFEPKITLQDAVGEAIAWVSSNMHSSVDRAPKDVARGTLAFCASDNAVFKTRKTAGDVDSRGAFNSLRVVSPNGLSIPTAGALSGGALSIRDHSLWSPLRREGLVMAGQALTDTLGGAGLDLLEAMEPELGD
jgi:hypothetical protein